jgi:folate-dependent phosphoribosylglycinamide formyltransferase PurN
VEHVGVKEAFNIALRFVIGLEHMEEDPVENQVVNLTKTIQQLQQRVSELELQTVPSTLQEVRYQREETTQSTV